MTNDNRNFVRNVLNANIFNIFPDNIERENVVDAILPDVITDIEETADEAFNMDDVLISMSRALYKKIVE